MKDNFLSCDWGTSTFRLRWVHTETRARLAETSSDEGIAATYDAWKTQGANAAARARHFFAVWERSIRTLEEQTQRSLAGTPLVVSGMASSSIGLQVVPYKELPFAVDGSDLRVEVIPAASAFAHDVLLISGVRTSDDVMRGEETQLVGALSGADVTSRRLLVFPGTHSKHVRVEGTQVTTFRTYMTGEWFDLLSRKSILADSVDATAALVSPEDHDAFEVGVRGGATGNLLQACFHVRTRSLLEGATKTASAHMLSGMLIGHELKDIAAESDPLTFVAQPRLTQRYRDAWQQLHPARAITVVDADEALVRGQRMIARSFGLL